LFRLAVKSGSTPTNSASARYSTSLANAASNASLPWTSRTSILVDKTPQPQWWKREDLDKAASTVCPTFDIVGLSHELEIEIDIEIPLTPLSLRKFYNRIRSLSCWCMNSLFLSSLSNLPCSFRIAGQRGGASNASHICPFAWRPIDRGQGYHVFCPPAEANAPGGDAEAFACSIVCSWGDAGAECIGFDPGGWSFAAGKFGS